MKIITLLDNNFPHQTYSSKFGASNILRWNRNIDNTISEIVITDMYLNDSIKNIKNDKICWLLEPQSIHPHIYNWIKNNHQIFKEIWTHDDDILNLPNSKFVPAGGCWTEEIGIFEKDKLCSFIASNKNFSQGHRFRQDIRKTITSDVHQYGRGYKDLSRKVDGLKNYAFSVAVENIKRDTYFTEKIIDCFLTGTIPIYWGTDKIANYFDVNGIIRFNTLGELNTIINSLSFDQYNSRKDAIEKNFQLAKDFIIAEEWGIK